MKFWEMRDGTKILPSKMSEQHLFFAWKKFGQDYSTERSDMLNKEISRRKIPHPKDFTSQVAFKKAVNCVRIKNKLGVT